MVEDSSDRSEFSSWMSYLEFANRVKKERRYAWDDEVEAFLEAVLATSENRTRTLPSGTVFWRAQLGVDWHYDSNEGIEHRMGFGPDRMKPIAHIVREGRANSVGIPVLYLASAEQTAISEVRPWIGSSVSLAQFRIVRDLKAIDLTAGFGSASFAELTIKQLLGEKAVDAKTKERAVWTDIDNSFSQPVDLSENASDYAPTQILAEVFLDAGYEAMVYRSHFGESGHNVVVFDPEDAEILNCGPYKVTAMTVEYSLMGNHWFRSQETD